MTVDDEDAAARWPSGHHLRNPRTEPPPPVSFVQSLRALALAALASIGVISLFARSAGPVAILYMALWTAPFVLGAVAAFVVPILAVWPASRRPSYLVAAVWGDLAAWCAIAWLSCYSPPDSHRGLSIWKVIASEVGFRPLLFPGLLGAAAGLLYAWLVRRSTLPPLAIRPGPTHASAERTDRDR